MMWGLKLIGSVIELYNKYFGARNTPSMIEAKRIENERISKQKFDEDLAKAQAGDQEALARIRASLGDNP